jgi:hypothetical protein
MQQSRRFSSLAALSAVRGATATTSGRLSFALRCYSTGEKKVNNFFAN